ncbi:DUF3618 domain-containing protein [Streptomyces sp. NPDC058157]|uniref:DUF3618 domain-containing protein n=1 Tax=Streptomyces sp. NPDC058157 TaxID=3346360 RepID=UPI0036E2D3CA
MSHQPRDHGPAPTPEDLRAQIERTRHELGQTVEALAAKADVKAQAEAKAVEVKERFVERAGVWAGRLRETAYRATGLTREKTPDAVVGTTAHAAAQIRGGAARSSRPGPVRGKGVSAAVVARASRTPLLTGASALAVVLLLRRGRRRRK